MYKSNRRLAAHLRTAALALLVACVPLSVIASAPNVAIKLASESVGTGVSVYFYNSEGAPVDVTASVVYQNPYVFDAYNNIIGNVDEYGVIRDPVTGAVI